MKFSVLAVIATAALSVNASYNDTAPTTISTYAYPTYTPPPSTGTGVPVPVPSSNATKTPVGPSSPTSPAEFTGAANAVALPVGGLAALGAVMAYFI